MSEAGKRAARKVLPRGVVSWIDRHRSDLVQRTRFDGFRITARHHSVVIDPDRATEPAIGIHLFGGCDLPALYALGPIIGPSLRQRVVIGSPGRRLTNCRADVLRQTLEEHPPDAIAEVTARLGLSPTYFRPLLFEPTFDVPIRGVGTVEKSVIVISGGASVIRAAYRHKEAGFLVDPGAAWLESSGEVTRATRQWVAETFERAGRMTVDAFAEDFAIVVKEIKERTTAEVLVFNTLTVEPGVLEHNYQLRRQPEAARRLEFHLAMAELAPKIGFHVVDVDDALKRAGMREQVDFAHFPLSAYQPIAAEAARLLHEIEVL
jgi:hypothetical protein